MMRNEKNNHPAVYGKNVYSIQFEEFNESGAFYEDGNMVVDGIWLVPGKRNLAPLHSNVYVS